MKLEHIKQVAEKLLSQLEPYCERIQIAGSIRRNKPYPKDIEIVCIPKTFRVGDKGYVPVQEFVDLVRSWPKVKGEPFGKYTQRHILGHPEGDVKLDLFMVKKGNWGLQLAIRTGSADFSHKVLANGWVKAGYKSIEGYLHKVDTGEKVFVLEEEDLFKLIGIDYVEPEMRNL